MGDTRGNYAFDMFVWTKMGVEAGEGLAQIVRRKEAERIEGNGQFWWALVIVSAPQFAKRHAHKVVGCRSCFL
jgi:hypothetical protein